MKKLRIRIAGQAGTGKTILALSIQEFLRSKGFKNITVDDFPEESALTEEAILSRQDVVLPQIGEETEVVIETLQTIPVIY